MALIAEFGNNFRNGITKLRRRETAEGPRKTGEEKREAREEAAEVPFVGPDSPGVRVRGLIFDSSSEASSEV